MGELEVCKSTVVLTPARRISRNSASSVSRASAACWCESFFRVFLLLRSLLAAPVTVLPSETLFFASATDAAVAACREWVWSVAVEVEVCFLLRPFFVEVLDMVVRIRLGTPVLKFCDALFLFRVGD